MKCSLFFFLIPFAVFANADKEEVVKKISREFVIQSDARIELDNKFGNIDIAIGPSNKVKIDIIITVKASNEKKAQESLDRISVSFEEGNNRVNAETSIESASGWTSWLSRGNVEMSINYNVTVPPDVYLDLTNKYGDIYLETTNRNINIDHSFGDIRLGDVNAKLNLQMAFSKGAISMIGDGVLDLSHSDIEMEDAKDVVMDLKYSNVKAGSFQKLRLDSEFTDFTANSMADVDYDGKYDNLTIGQVTHITAQSGYTEITIQELNGEGVFDMRYGELRLENIRKDFSKLSINSSFTGVNLDFVPDASFSVDVETKYCEITHTGLNVSENVDKGESHSLKANKGTGTKPVIIRMNYGALRIL